MDKLICVRCHGEQVILVERFVKEDGTDGIARVNQCPKCGLRADPLKRGIYIHKRN